ALLFRLDTTRNKRPAKRNGQTRRVIHTLRCVSDQNEKWLFLFENRFQDLNVEVGAVFGQSGVIGRQHAIDLSSLEFVGETGGAGTQDYRGYGLAEIAPDALRKNQQFGSDGFEFVVLVLCDDED